MPDRPAAAEQALWRDLGADVTAEYRTHLPRSAADALGDALSALRSAIARGRPDRLG